MSCLEAELLSAYADGEAGPGERVQVEGHLSSCGTCRAELRLLEGLKGAVRAQPAPGMPAELREALGRLLPGRPSWRAGIWEGLRRPAWAPACGLAAALVAAAGWWTISGGDEEFSIDAALAAHRVYATTMPMAETERLLAEMPDDL